MADLPVVCQLCGEQMPDADAVWDHECPEWDRTRRNNLPTLASHKTIVKWFEGVNPRNLFRRMILWNIRRSLGPDADILDALVKLGPRYAHRYEAMLVRRGMAPPSEVGRTELEKVRRQYEIETEMEGNGDDERRARTTVTRRRHRNRVPQSEQIDRRPAER